jgi:hypothetical protein
MQKGKSQKYVYPVTLDKKDREALKFISDKLNVSKADGIRDAISYYSEYLRGIEVVKPRKVSRGQAAKEIVDYLKGKEKVYTDEIADALNIDFDLVNKVLMDLWQEGSVEQIE